MHYCFFRPRLMLVAYSEEEAVMWLKGLAVVAIILFFV